MIMFFFLLVSCDSHENQGITPVGTESKGIGSTPAEFLNGELLYQSHCAGCHGEKGKGSERGPTFLSPIYLSNHHGDESFILAARNGARAHHWQFGDMPPVSGVKDEEVRKIVGYVRWLQKGNKLE
jgi:mono/diheme cytochrome c family protein